MLKILRFIAVYFFVVGVFGIVYWTHWFFILIRLL